MSKQEKLFERWVKEGGGDSLTIEQTSEALAFRDENPVAAGRIRAAIERRQQEERDKETLKVEWLARGNEERDFDKHYPSLRDEHNRKMLEEMDRGARDEAARRMARSF